MGPFPLSVCHYEMLRWDWEENTVDPATLDVSEDGGVVCVWRCPRARHRWVASIRELWDKGSTWFCPQCTPFEDPPATWEDSFEARYPTAAALWDEMRVNQAVSKVSKPASELQPGNYGEKIILMCPQPRHMAATVSTIDFILGHIQEGRYCHKCAQNRKYDSVAPGDVFMGPPAASSGVERQLAERLGAYFELASPGVNALMYGAEYRGAGWGRPDILIPGLRVVVEFDGTGLDIEWGHDTPEGLESDLDKDRLTRGVGWEVVRIRTGGLAKLGPHDVELSAGTVPDPAEVAWQVLMAAMTLESLDEGMAALKEPALTLLQEGA
jgi:hypothetical protein